MSARGTKTTNSAAEVLRGLLQDLAVVKTYPDADLEFLNQIEMQIVTKLREPAQQLMASQGVPPAPPGAGPNPLMAAMGGGGMPTFPGPPSGGVPGIRREAGIPPVDELRRLIGGVQG